MSEESGPVGSEDAGAVGTAPPPERARLVSPEGLVPRTREFGGARRLVPTLRVLYRQASANFAALLLVAIGLAVVAVFHNGGLTLMGQQIRNALVLGAIYALVAIGYTMVYGIIELINFAHGDVFTLSGFYAIIFADRLHLNSLATSSFGGLVVAVLIVFPLSMAAAGLTGMAIERVAYRRLRDSPRLAPLITAIGVSFLLEGVMLVLFGPDNVATGSAVWITGKAFQLGGVVIG